jgi:hypothetical protein
MLTLTTFLQCDGCLSLFACNEQGDRPDCARASAGKKRQPHPIQISCPVCGSPTYELPEEENPPEAVCPCCR